MVGLVKCVVVSGRTSAPTTKWCGGNALSECYSQEPEISRIPLTGNHLPPKLLLAKTTHLLEGPSPAGSHVFWRGTMRGAPYSCRSLTRPLILSAVKLQPTRAGKEAASGEESIVLIPPCIDPSPAAHDSLLAESRTRGKLDWNRVMSGDRALWPVSRKCRVVPCKNNRMWPSRRPQHQMTLRMR